MVASGYYAHSGIQAFWAFWIAGVCLYRIGKAILMNNLTKMFFRVTPGVLLYAILVLVESIDFQGVYGIYYPRVPAAMRILETDTLACCSFGAMHLILTIAISMEGKKVPTFSAKVFIAAAVLKVSLGVATAIAYLVVGQKKVMVYNDASLLLTFLVSVVLFIWLCWQVQLRIAAHLAKVSSQVLTQSLTKVRRILVVAIVAAVAVPGFLAYNVYDHASGSSTAETAADPNVYKFNYSSWFKLLWASFLLWLSRPSNAEATQNTATDGHSATPQNGSKAGSRDGGGGAIRLGNTTDPDPSANPDSNNGEV